MYSIPEQPSPKVNDHTGQCSKLLLLKLNLRTVASESQVPHGAVTLKHCGQESLLTEGGLLRYVDMEVLQGTDRFGGWQPQPWPGWWFPCWKRGARGYMPNTRASHYSASLGKFHLRCWKGGSSQPSAVSRACSRWGLAFTRAAPFHLSCLWLSWTGSHDDVH